MTKSELNDIVPGATEASRSYRAAGFDEEPPADVDRAILEAAARMRRPRLSSFVPPLAIAATVVLSVSIVMRFGVLNDDPEILSDESVVSDTVPAGAARALEEVVFPAESPAESPPDSVNAALNALQQFVAPQASDTATTELEAVEMRVRQAPDFEAAQEQAAEPLSLNAGAAVSARVVCLEADREQAAAWFDCILELLQQGSVETARSELDAFLVSYPDSPLAEELERLLNP